MRVTPVETNDVIQTNAKNTRSDSPGLRRTSEKMADGIKSWAGRPDSLASVILRREPTLSQRWMNNKHGVG